MLLGVKSVAKLFWDLRTDLCKQSVNYFLCLTVAVIEGRDELCLKACVFSLLLNILIITFGLLL